MKDDLRDLIVLSCIALVLSIFVSLFYILYFVDKQRVTKIPVIICYILLMLFLFLNIIVNIDLILDLFKSIPRESRIVGNILSYYYTYFNAFSLIIRWFIFPIYINYFETGYKTFWKTFCEIFEIIWKKIKKKLESSLWKALLVIGLILAIATVILYFMIKDKFGLKDPISYVSYINIALDIIPLFEIYTNVGFFLIQTFIDAQRLSKESLIKSYYYYSKYSVLLKAVNYFIKLLKTDLKTGQTLIANKEVQLYGFALEFNKVREMIKGSKEKTINETQIMDKNEANTGNEQPKNNNKISSEARNMEKKGTKIEIQNYIVQENKSENILAEHVRKYKKILRRMIKMSKLYKDLDEEKDADIRKTCCHKCWLYTKYCIIMSAMIMVAFSDFFSPIFFMEKHNSSKSSNSTISNITNITDLIEDVPTSLVIVSDIVNTTNNENVSDNNMLNTVVALIIALIFVIIIIFINSAYTIIMIYSTSRRYYISGDFLSGYHSNDNISLMKTVKEICGMAFSLIYCNIYIYKSFSSHNFIFSQRITIPDYEIKYGISVYMIAKLVIIILAMIIFKNFDKVFFFYKNDLGKFNQDYKNEDYYYIYKDGFEKFQKEFPEVDNFLMRNHKYFEKLS